MRSSQCLFNSAIALRRVFINTPATTEYLGQLSLQRVFLPSLSSPQQRCSYATKRSFGPRSTPQAPAKPEGALPRDDDITSPFVLIRDEETGKLSEPVRPWDVLGQINTVEQSLVMVADPAKLKGSSGLQYPICRIIDRKAEREAQQAKEKAEPGKGSKTKELELNWTIGPADLERNLERLRGWLNKGYFVEVRLLKKSKKGKKRDATQEEVKMLFKRVEDAIKEMKNVKETKGMEGVMGKQIRLFLQGTKVAQEKQVAEEQQALQAA